MFRFNLTTLSTILSLTVLIACLGSPNTVHAASTEAPVTICLATDNSPFSSRSNGEAGIDIDIAQELGRRMQRPVAFQWVQIPNRGGLGKALRHSIGKETCDVFLGIPMVGNVNEELTEKNLVASSPYFSASYVLVSNPASNIKALSDLKTARHVGAVSATPADLYLFQQELERVPYGSNGDLLKALNSGEIDAALIWSSFLARLVMAGTPAQVSVRDVVPGTELNSNFVAAMRPTDKDLIKQVNKSLAVMQTDGFLASLLDRYGIGKVGMQADGRQFK